jgi:hypothetical protein
MAITTAGDLVAFAMRTSSIIGVGQTPLAEDAQTGLQLLINILAEWQRRRWLVWSLQELVLVSTGATSYSVGAAGDFAVTRPERIDSAFARLLTSLPNPVDYPLRIVDSREDYNTIALKRLTTFPTAAFYQSDYPTGTLFIWPIPPATLYELHIFCKTTLPPVAVLTDPLTGYPPEYMSAMLYTLANELAMNYGQTPQPALVGRMRAAVNVLRMANTQIPDLAMPAGVAGRLGSSVAASASPGFQTGGW